MTKTVLVAGTASHVGKSTIVTGLCRRLARAGVAVAPFKAQNMSNNARVVLTPDGEWGEIGVSQYVQAMAAGITPTTDVNPVLLKPRGTGSSQLIVNGVAVADVAAGSYYDNHWAAARQAVLAAYERLATTYDVIVAEGAGSIAEINLHHRDLANVETAGITDAEILLVVDIERGGAFASLYGTIALMPDDLRDRVSGAIINKFRGDSSLLESGIEEIEARTGVPILGVLPYDDPKLPEEDSVSIPDPSTSHVIGTDDGVEDEAAVTVVVPRLPRIANTTDFEPIARMRGVRVRYVAIDNSLAGADAVVLPGSKNTVDDLVALRDAGFERRLAQFNGPIIGICAGYQMLGTRILNAGIESTRGIETIDGFGLLPVKTRFSPSKHVEYVERRLIAVPPLGDVTGTVQGYEIHMGRTDPTGPIARPLGSTSASTDRVLGTYLHGLFENAIARRGFISAVRASAGKPEIEMTTEDTTWSFDVAANLIADHANLGGVEAVGDVDG